MNIDQIMKELGVKYIFVESGEAAIRTKCEEQDIPFETVFNENDKTFFWVELSWGSCDDEFDFAFNNFGTSFDQAFKRCTEAFFHENEWEDVVRFKRIKALQSLLEKF